MMEGASDVEWNIVEGDPKNQEKRKRLPPKSSEDTTWKVIQR